MARELEARWLLVDDVEGLVFPSEAGTVIDSSNLMQRVLKKAGRRAGVPWVGFHTFRHTCATTLFRRGAKASNTHAARARVHGSDQSTPHVSAAAALPQALRLGQFTRTDLGLLRLCADAGVVRGTRDRPISRYTALLIIGEGQAWLAQTFRASASSWTRTWTLALWVPARALFLAGYWFLTPR
jgi:hypothetical protein